MQDSEETLVKHLKQINERYSKKKWHSQELRWSASIPKKAAMGNKQQKLEMAVLLEYVLKGQTPDMS